MFKIPNEEKKYSQTNQSDIFGNIWYTKGITFDEEGYIKSSPRAVSLYNSDYDSSFNVPASFGRTSTGSWVLATIESPYNISLVNGTSSILKDTDNGDDAPPTFATSTFGIWFNKLWNTTTATKLYYKTISNGNWIDTGVSLTTGIAHPLCLFEKASTLLIGNGNEVKQLDTSYAAGTYAQLTLSTDYEVNGIAYNNNLAGIATRLASTVEGCDKEAQFFIWDGSISSANQAYGVGSDACLAVAPYKSSFVVLTRAGQLKYFNGGGFDDLASFPVYFKDSFWLDPVNGLGYGDIMKVEGDTIYINIQNNMITSTLGDSLEGFFSGIWCFDPKVGLHHKYSPSVSKAYNLSVQQAGVDVTNNKFTKYDSFSLPTSPTIPATGNPVLAVSTTVGGLKQGQVYWIIKSSSTEFKLASTYEDALAFNPVNITSTGGSYSYFLALDIKDYGQANSQTFCGGMTLTGYKSYLYDQVLFGGRYKDTNSSSYIEHLNSTITNFRAINYFTTVKLFSGQTEDNYQKIFIKYRPLKTDDEIIVKYKTSEIVGLPNYNSNNNTSSPCSVTDSTTITTTGDMSVSKTQFDAGVELECEILSGSGAGQMSKVSNIEESSGTYTITLEDTIDGWVAGDSCEIKIDNWKYLNTISSTDGNGWKEIPLTEPSKWLKLKVVLDGSDIAIEELKVINKTHLPSE